MGYTEKFTGKYAYTKQEGLPYFYKHELYTTWRMMNTRCYDTRHKAYHRYGGRGIEVCEMWRWDNPSGFVNFLKDVGERPVGTTLDKIDNNKGYFPDNVKWATKKEQQNNLGVGMRNTTGVLGVTEVMGRYQVTAHLNGVAYIVGIFRLDQLNDAKQRFLDVQEVKMSQGDDKAIEYVESLDPRTITNKRFRLNKTSKYYGVSWDSSRQKWRAMTSYREYEGGTLINKFIGRFDDEYEAHVAVLKYIDMIKEKGYIKHTIDDS